MTRRLTTLFIALVLGYAAVAADQGRPPVGPVLGFAGYEYGSGITGIANDMKSEGYSLIDRTDSALWYSTTFVGIDCELGYIFSGNTLVVSFSICVSLSVSLSMCVSQCVFVSLSVCVSLSV